MMTQVFALLLLVCTGITLADVNDDEIEEVPSTHVPRLLSSTTLVEATVGESVKFPCDVDDLGDFVLLWKKEKNNVLFAGDLRIVRDDRIQVNKTSLHIHNIQPKDSAEYICLISTSPPLELSHTLDVQYPPVVKPQPQDGFITVKEGETVTLTCSATGNPKPGISWKHAGRHYDSVEGQSYHITSAQKADSGEYECIADNRVGDPASAVITVEVVSAPKVYPNPKSGLVVVKEKEPVSISCEASGDPTPVITWKRPGGEKPSKVRDENKIVISEATRSHAGTYECVANNSLGIFTSATIRVQVLYPPEIEIPHPWIHAGEGTNVNITCVIRGEPPPSVMWKRADGQTIHGGEHYRISSNGHVHSLEVRHLREDDFGRYECVASNSLSSATDNAHIIGTPQVPTFTSKHHGTQSTKYTLKWTVDSHTPVNEYSLMFRKKGNSEDWQSKTVPATDVKEGSVHTQMFQLIDLEPAASYEAVVTARNKFGWSKQSDALVFKTKDEASEPSSPTEESVTRHTVLEIDELNEKSEQRASASSAHGLSLLVLFTLTLFSINRSLL